MRTYSVYLSTTSGIKAPDVKTNLAVVKWQINWRAIFGARTGECRVRAKLLSASSTSLTWAANTGSLRASFASNSSQSNNGFNLGAVVPILDPTTATGQTTYLSLDTTGGDGATIIIPNSNNDFWLTLLNATEADMANVPEYQLWLYFDVDDELPLVVSDDYAQKTIFYPR